MCRETAEVKLESSMTAHCIEAGSCAVFNIAFAREGEKISYYNMEYSYLVTHPGTSPSEQSLTLLSGRDVALSLWYSDSERIFILNF